MRPCAADVILVEDNQSLREELVFQLRHAGFTVRGANDAGQLATLLAQRRCDILVLDVNLPGEDGFEIARRLCDRARLGIVMLTARGDLDDRLRGFDEGADLYLVKPVDRRELVACINSLYLRVRAAADSPSGWVLLSARRELLSPDGRRLELSPLDVAALACLLEQPGSTRHRDALVSALGFGFMSFPEGRTNTVMSRLRQKLDAFSPDLRILTWRNRGYSFVGPDITVTGHPGPGPDL